MQRTIAVGLTVLAGAALLETALIPGILIGGAAVLVPKYLPKALPKLTRRLEKMVSPSPSPQKVAKVVALLPSERSNIKTPLAVPMRNEVRRAIVKTITFRIIVTTLDFSVNYLVIGEVAIAAGLSGFSLVVGPIFYFIHEMLWNKSNASKFVVETSGLGFAIPRALVKTITFRTMATTMDFLTNYVVVRDIATAATLTASGAILGPFVYFGHEKLWEHYGALGDRILDMLFMPVKTVANGRVN